MRDLSPVSRRSSTLFGIHSERKAMQQLKTVRAQNRRFTFIAAAAIFLLVVALICLIAFDMYNNANMAASRENRSRIEHLSDLMTAQHWKVVEDVQLSSPGQSHGEEYVPTTNRAFQRRSSTEEVPVDFPEDLQRGERRTVLELSPPVELSQGNPGLREDLQSGERRTGLELSSSVEPSQGYLFWPKGLYEVLSEDRLRRGKPVEHSSLDQRRSAHESSGDWVDSRWTEEQKNFSNELHANHRYTDGSVELPEERLGGTPRPFTLQMDLSPKKENENLIHEEPPTLYGLQNQFSSHSMNYQATIAPPQDIRPVPNYHAFKLPKKHHKKVLEGFKPPMHFRGFYMRPKERKVPQEERNEQYYEKINDYFGKLHLENHTMSVADDTSESDSISEKNSEFYTQADVPTKDSMQVSTRKNSATKPKTKPFTVMLDIYPMEKEEEESLVDGILQRPKDTIYIPMQSNGHFLQPNGAASNLIPEKIKFMPQQVVPQKYLQPVVIPPKRKNRMIMKLNLYPRKQPQRRMWNFLSRQDDYEEYGDDYGDEEGGQEEHHCNGIVGHNPYGKPITAKWKDKHGHLIHAKYIALKQWDRHTDDGEVDEIYDEEEEEEEEDEPEYVDPR